MNRDSFKIDRRKVIVHLVCWVLFLFYELSAVRFTYGKLEPLYIYLPFFTLNMLYFYGQVAVFKLAFGFQRYFSGLAVLLLMLSVYLLAKRGLDLLLYPKSGIQTTPAMMHSVLSGYLFRSLYFTILATFYWAAGYIGRYKRQAEASERRQLIVERDKAEIRNAYLQQQISPHLLFNTLNFIYSDIYRQSPGAGRSVLLLSDILRFGLDAAGADGKTDVAAELGHLRQLVEINQYRFPQGFFLALELAGNFSEERIIPLVLLTLAENVFKHGDLNDPVFPGLIRVKRDGGFLSFYSRNLKKSKSVFARSAQLGLQNIRLRLDYAYPDAYTLDIREEDELFELTLTVPV